jgi:hypothetical protein
MEMSQGNSPEQLIYANTAKGCALCNSKSTIQKHHKFLVKTIKYFEEETVLLIYMKSSYECAVDSKQFLPQTSQTISNFHPKIV